LYPYGVLPLDSALPFDPARDAEFFAALPARPAVFLVEPRHEGAEPYLVRTAELRRRVERLLSPPAELSKRLNLREFAAGVRYRLTGSKFEQALLHYQHARALFPARYRDLVRLRPPALLKINLRNPYPRCFVIRRILADGAAYFGPFQSRKSAEAFASEFLNLFKVRRCQIKIRRDPDFPGCIYSEMKMCLAPCFAGCSKEDYDVEVARLVVALDSSGGSLTAAIENDRASASEALDFERAAALHKRLDKVSGILRGLPEIVRPVDRLDAVILQPSAEPATIAVFAIRNAFIADPLLLRFGELASQPRSVEEILREHLAPATSAPPIVGNDRAEHLSLLARWYYSKPRAGEIFFPKLATSADAPLDWPYRRIIRACSRLLSA
jgi:excinuclease UvrABC nuclease subunit